MSSTTLPNAVPHQDWLATRSDIWSKTEDHKAATVAIGVTAASVAVVAVTSMGAFDLLVVAATTVAVFALSALLHRVSLRRSTAKFAPIYQVVTAEIGMPVTLLELTELIETNGVVVAGEVVRAEVVDENVVVTSTSAPAHHGDEHVSDSTVRIDRVRDTHFVHPMAGLR
jgi:hypothetical protein